MRPLVALLILLAAPSVAQEIDCATAMAQQDLNHCAHADWQVADADLNQAYAAAMDLMRQWDEGLPAEEQGGAAALKEAQRAWITFRDKACAAEGYAMKGGSAEPLLVYGCMARVTEERASHLWAMVQAYGDL